MAVIEASVIEAKEDGTTAGHGTFAFVFPPRIGEIIQLPSSAPSLEFYTVTAIEHSPSRSPTVTRSERQTPSVTFTVRWSHDWEPPEND